MALRMAAGGYGLNFIKNDNNLSMDVGRYFQGEEAFAKYVGENYDSSSDYWLLKRDGTLKAEFDKNGNLITDLNVEYVMRNGEIGKKKLIDDTTGSGSQSFYRYLGVDQASHILGYDVNNISGDRIDKQLLKQVTDADVNEFKAMLNDPDFSINNLTPAQKQAYIAQKVMKNAGMTWSDETKWSSGEGVSFNLKRDGTDGNILFDTTLKDGEYGKTTITADAERDSASFLYLKNGIINPQYAYKDKITFTQRDLDGNIIDSETFKTHTVDSLANGVRNQPHYDPVFGNIQGNTIAAGDFSLRYRSTSNYPLDPFVIFDATTISGINIDIAGKMPGDDDRWLMHQNRTNKQQKKVGEDYTNVLVDGCFGFETDVYVKMLNTLDTLGAYSGYEFDGYLTQKYYYYR